MARAMIARTEVKQIAFRYVLADLWFASAKNMVFIKRKAGKNFVMPLKSNRRVALSEGERNRGRWKALSSLELPEGATRTLYLHGGTIPLLVSRQVFKNEDRREGTLIKIIELKPNSITLLSTPSYTKPLFRRPSNN